MATVTPTLAYPSRNTVRFTYATMANGDTGVPIHERWSDFSDRVVQVLGTFGAGGNVRIQGTLDSGTTYATLTDPQGNALDVTAAKIEQILEGVPVMRPNITAGDGTTAITVVITARRPRGSKEA